MHIELQRQTGVSYVKQIKSAMADRIRSGLLAEGSPLPSIRRLSKQLSVSAMTVVQAYEELEQEGLVERIQGKGTYVRTHTNPTFDPAPQDPYQWQHALTDYLPRAHLWRHEQHVGHMGINLSVASVEPALLPQKELAEDLARLVQESPEMLVRYAPVQGDRELREELAKYHRERGIQVTAEEVLITSGVQQGIDLVARCFLGRGDVVVVEAPTYPSAIDAFRARGATVIPVPVDQEGMRLDILLSICDLHPPKMIYTIPTYHNPTGTVMSLRRRQELIELAQSYRCLLVEDNPWNDIAFESSRPISLKQLDEDGHVIHMTGFSKSMAPGYRVACLLATGTVLTRLIGAKTTADLGTPLLTQRAILPFLRSAQGKSFQTKLAQTLLHKRNLVLDLFEKNAPQGVRWTVPAGGLNIWVTLPDWLRAEEVLHVAKQQGVTFLPGSAFYPGEPEFHHLRLSFAAVSDEELRKAITTLCRVLTTFLQTPRAAFEQGPIM